MKSKLFALLMVAALVLSACGAPAQPAAAPSSGEAAAPAAAEAPAPAAAEAPAEAPAEAALAEFHPAYPYSPPPPVTSTAT